MFSCYDCRSCQLWLTKAVTVTVYWTKQVSQLSAVLKLVSIVSVMPVQCLAVLLITVAMTMLLELPGDTRIFICRLDNS